MQHHMTLRSIQEYLLWPSYNGHLDVAEPHTEVEVETLTGPTLFRCLGQPKTHLIYSTKPQIHSTIEHNSSFAKTSEPKHQVLYLAELLWSHSGFFNYSCARICIQYKPFPSRYTLRT